MIAPAIRNVPASIRLEGVIQKLGFYTTRWVEANNPEEAELQAVALVKNDGDLRAAVRNKAEDPPTIQLEEIIEVADFENIQAPGAGYSFYAEE